MKTKNVTANKSYSLALSVIKVYKKITTEKKEFVLSKQLLRSGTAVGALIREAQNGESKKDFIHKLAIAQKECDESLYWIDLLYDSGYINVQNHNHLQSECSQMLKILRSIILTTKKNMK